MGRDYEYLDDYAVGEKFISPSRTITEADIVNFAGLTGDWHPLHTDVEYAAKTPFKERIAHGMLTLSVGMALPFRLGPYSSFLPRSFIAFYGMESVRFTGPTKIGDTIHCEVEVAEIMDKGPDRGVLTTRNSIRNQRGELLVTYIIKVLCGKRKK
ncbi:MAG TPA: MaoC/PaaZ C-terminal domain-containing protein [Syntrophales bacterium]|nr:MaoC/PaaZ C-terminal domain-containing protein [Syntrophales bacterium]HPL64835.1 MaoC/PaaZ C-terminal domain-containing protein [Syntrophales bacterium]